MGKRGTRAAKVHRQSIVRSLMARGMEQHEILTMLSTDKRYADENIEKNGEIVPNPSFVGNVKTGEPVDKSTISRDWKEIHQQWLDEAKVDVEAHFARQLAEIREAKRIAQSAKDRKEFRQLVQLEMKLLGTPKPEKKELRWDDKQLESMDNAKSRIREKLAIMGVVASTDEGDKE